MYRTNNLRLELILFAVWSLLCLGSWSTSWAEDDFAPRSSLDISAELVALKSDGQKLVNAIRNTDIGALLEFFPVDDLVAIDFDRNMRRSEIENSLRTKQGLVYATLFDSYLLRRILHQRHALSLKDYFLRAPKITVVTKELNGRSSEHDPLLASLVLLWSTRPAQGFFDPIMCRYKNGWKFRTFFTQP